MRLNSLYSTLFGFSNFSENSYPSIILMEPSIWQMLSKHDPNSTDDPISADDSIPDLSKSS